MTLPIAFCCCNKYACKTIADFYHRDHRESHLLGLTTGFLGESTGEMHLYSEKTIWGRMWVLCYKFISIHDLTGCICFLSDGTIEDTKEERRYVHGPRLTKSTLAKEILAETALPLVLFLIFMAVKSAVFWWKG